MSGEPEATPVEITTDALPLVHELDDEPGTYRLTFEDACCSIDLSTRQLRYLVARAATAYADRSTETRERAEDRDA